MDQRHEILVISSELEDRRALVDILHREHLDPICASTANESQQLFVKRKITLVFCDRQLPDGTYRHVLNAMRSLNTNAPLVVMSRVAGWDEYVEALHEGAFDLIVSPCGPCDVSWMMLRAQDENKKRAPIGPPKAYDDVSSQESIRARDEIRILPGCGVGRELQRKASSA